VIHLQGQSWRSITYKQPSEKRHGIL
jgi:hypothetical protein